MDIIVFLLELIGTIAFAASGAMVGIHKRMDIFGVIVMAITTAVGGGVMRDIILGLLPPTAFVNPLYVIIASISALVLFVAMYHKGNVVEGKMFSIYDKTLMFMDAIGLGVFTMIGVEKAYVIRDEKDYFLIALVGILTGVGGGVIRDIMAQRTPLIFVKQIYASAAICGAIFCLLCMPYSKIIAMVGGAGIIIAIRFLSVIYHWNLPKVKE